MSLSRTIKYYLEYVVDPFVSLGIRIYMWNVFYYAGRQKFDNFLNNDWQSTIFLFKEVHPVPMLSPEIAAVLATVGELGLSCLLVLGLCSRFAAAGLLILVGVIEFQFQHNDVDYATLPEHMMWALLLGVILTKGPGILSFDKMFFSGRK